MAFDGYQDCHLYLKEVMTLIEKFYQKKIKDMSEEEFEDAFKRVSEVLQDISPE